MIENYAVMIALAGFAGAAVCVMGLYAVRGPRK